LLAAVVVVVVPTLAAVELVAIAQASELPAVVVVLKVKYR
jgi:hypothetical protein